MDSQGVDSAALSSRIVTEFSRRAKSFSVASLFVKGVLITVGGTAATALQFFNWPAGGHPEWTNIAGIAASVLVMIGGFFVLVTEKDTSQQLALAHRAVEWAKNVEAELAISYEIDSEFDRIISLHQAAEIMRGRVERFAVDAVTDDDKIAADMMKLAGRLLYIAAGFSPKDQWTMCLYKREVDAEGNAYLRCVAQKRAIECELHEARTWPVGEGVVGMAQMRRREIIVPDMLLPEAVAMMGSGAIRRENDDDRYRSMIAIPVRVGDIEEPWGVASATNDRKEHFNYESDQGVNAAEPIRLLSRYMALAVAVRGAHSKAPGHPDMRGS
jgi:hypothetical protein